MYIKGCKNNFIGKETLEEMLNLEVKFRPTQLYTLDICVQQQHTVSEILGQGSDCFCSLYPTMPDFSINAIYNPLKCALIERYALLQLHCGSPKKSTGSNIFTDGCVIIYRRLSMFS